MNDRISGAARLRFLGDPGAHSPEFSFLHVLGDRVEFLLGRHLHLGLGASRKENEGGGKSDFIRCKAQGRVRASSKGDRYCSQSINGMRERV